MRRFNVGQQVNFKVGDKFAHGYIYANSDSYSVGYWDGSSNTEKIKLNASIDDISELICPHTKRICEKIQCQVNYCKHCDKSRFTSYINPFKENKFKEEF